MNALQSPKDSTELLDMYYKDMRSHLLEVAAAFDRIERQGASGDDPRLKQLRELAHIAVDESPDRAKRYLEHLSD